jgi:hypothetical protein
MKISRYEQQVGMERQQAAAGAAAQPAQAAYGEGIGAALKGIGEGMARLAQVNEGIIRHERDIKLNNFESRAKLLCIEYSAGLEADNNYEGYGAKYEQFGKNLDELGAKELGGGLYGRWKQNAGKIFMAQTGYTTERIAAQKKTLRLQSELENTLKNNAFLAASSAGTKTIDMHFQSAKKMINAAYLPEDGGIGIIGEREKKTLERYFETELNNSAASAVTALLQQDNPAAARAKLETLKKYIEPETYNALNKNVKTGELDRYKQDVWSVVSRKRIGDAEVDLGNAYDYTANLKGKTQEEKDDIFSFIRGKNQAEQAAVRQYRQTQEREFENTVIAGKTQGVNYDKALQTATRYGYDEVDTAAKQKYVHDIYTVRNAASNPDIYLELWKGVQDGSADEKAIKRGYLDGGINAADYRALVKDLFNEGGNAGQTRKEILNRIKLTYQSEIPDKEKLNKFLAETARQSAGKTAAEIYAVAKTLAQEKVSIPWGLDQKQYLHDYKTYNKNLEFEGAFIRAHPELGADAFKALKAGYEAANADEKKGFGQNTLDDLNKRFTGKLFEAGTIENITLKFMAENNVPATFEALSEMVKRNYTRAGLPAPDYFTGGANAGLELKSGGSKGLYFTGARAAADSDDVYGII